ncbi:MAG: DNA repair protein RecO [Pseudomonadota bacterium]
MQWSDEGLVLSVRAHGETSAIAEVFTRDQGRALGLVRGGRSRRIRPVLQPGNHVEVVWKARLEEHLGNLTVELREGFAATALESRMDLAGLSSMCALLRLLPERDPHRSLYEVTLFVLGYFGQPDIWPALMARWELELLEELGFGLDLTKCAATGAKDDLTFVSPKSATAVSADAGAAYADRLLRLPRFLLPGSHREASTVDVLDAYNRDGFLAPVRIMSPEKAEAIRQQFEAAERDHPEVLEKRGRSNAHLVFPFLDEIVHDPFLLDCVEDLIGSAIGVWGSVLFIKEAHDPGFVTWHQDFTYNGLEPHEGTSAWLALTPSTLESGCMRMIPGTHKQGMFTHRDTFGENNILTRGQTIEGIDESTAVDLALQPGEVSFHHPRTVHASAPNRSDQRRLGFTIQSYLPPHVVQTKGDGYVQYGRGDDVFRNMLEVRRPTGTLVPDELEMRARINDLWTEQLYDGAEKRREL